MNIVDDFIRDIIEQECNDPQNYENQTVSEPKNYFHENK